MSVPKKCPMCGEVLNWKKVDEQRKGFSGGKATFGCLFFGPLFGLLFGAFGKKKVTMCCGTCRFQHEYKK